MAQINGFSRAQVELLAFKSRTDTHAAWLGSVISDKYVASMCEQADKLNAQRSKCTRAGWLVVTGKARRAWHVEVKHNGAGVYVRNAGEAGELVGSVDTLRSIYGEAKIYGTRAEAEKTIAGVKTFNALEKRVEAKTKTEKTEKTKTEAKGKTVAKGKLAIKRK